MLPIPKELQNTKAIPFMEWYIKYYIDYEGSTDEILNFLNQSFTPEMLQEYFEGWEKIKDYFKYENVIVFYDESINSYAIYDDEDNCYCFKTLNDLITLCNLAGVELTWKGE